MTPLRPGPLSMTGVSREAERCRRRGSWNRAAAAQVAPVMTTISFIGSGNIGSTVARLAVDAGYDVVVSNSRGPETLADRVASRGSRARAATAPEAAEAGDLVVLAIPLGR